MNAAGSRFFVEKGAGEIEIIVRFLKKLLTNHTACDMILGR